MWQKAKTGCDAIIDTGLKRRGGIKIANSTEVLAIFHLTGVSSFKVIM